MPKQRRSEQFLDPSWKMKNLTILVIQILAFFCKGIWSNNIPGFTLTVPTFVMIQQGLSLHIPCRFTYKSSDSNEKLSGYWLKNKKGAEFCFDRILPRYCAAALLMATTDDKHAVDRSAENRFYLTGDLNHGECSLSIAQVQVEDEGTYYFRIVGDGRLRFSYSSAYHYTSPQISVTDQNQDMTIRVNLSSVSPADSSPEEGDKTLTMVVAQAGVSIRLHCHAEGRLDPILAWTKGKKNISIPKWGEDHVVQLTKITSKDAGEYQCQAENQHGSAKQAVWVTVQYAPELSRNPLRNTTCQQQNNSILCNCSFEANPPAQIQWQVDGETITEKNGRRDLKVTSLMLENEVTSSLNWIGSMEVDHRIMCIASNSLGVYTVQFPFSTFRGCNNTDPFPGVASEILNEDFGHYNRAIFFLLGLIKFLFCTFFFFFCAFRNAPFSQKGSALAYSSSSAQRRH